MVTRYKTAAFQFDYTKFRNDLVAFRDAHGFKHCEIDELAGIGYGNTSNIIGKKTTNHTMNVWLSLANAMDIDVRTYFVLAD